MVNLGSLFSNPLGAITEGVSSLLNPAKLGAEVLKTTTGIDLRPVADVFGLATNPVGTLTSAGLNILGDKLADTFGAGPEASAAQTSDPVATLESENINFPGKKQVLANFKKYAPKILNYELSSGKHSSANFEVVAFVFLNRLIAERGDIDKVLKAWNPGDTEFSARLEKPFPPSKKVDQAIENTASFRPQTDFGRQAWSKKWTDYAHRAPNEAPEYHQNLTNRFQGLIDGQKISIGTDPNTLGKIKKVMSNT